MAMSLRSEGGGLRRLLALWFLLAAVLSSCHATCGEQLEPQGEPLELLRAVRLPADATPVRVDISDADHYFLVAGMRGPIQIWSERPVETQAAASLATSGTLLAARFSREGVFFAEEQGSVGIWNWRENRSTFVHDFGRRARQATIGADGRFIAFGGAVVDVASERELGEPRPIASQSALAFSPNEERVISAGFQEPWIVVRDLPGGAAREWLAPGKVSHAALSSTAATAAASMEDGEIHFWRQPSGESLGSWQGRKEVRALCFSPGDTSVYVADPAGFSVIDVARARETWRASIDGILWVFSCDGTMAAAGSTDGRVWLWDTARQVLRARLQLSSFAVVAMELSSIRNRLVAADEKGEAAIWRWR
jgi:WD40 repeat protein